MINFMIKGYVMGVMYCIRFEGLFIVTLLRPDKQIEELYSVELGHVIRYA